MLRHINYIEIMILAVHRYSGRPILASAYSLQTIIYVAVLFIYTKKTQTLTTRTTRADCPDERGIL